MIRSFSSRLLVAAVLTAGFLCPGCGTGEYNRRLEARVKELRAGDPGGTGGVAMREPDLLKEIDGKKILVPIPGVFTDPWLPPDAPVAEARKRIPFAHLAGHERTYEGFIEAQDGSKTPYYCYLAAENLGGDSSTKTALFGRLDNALRKVSPDVKLREKKLFKRPDGTPSQWLEWRVSGPMDFVRRTAAGQEETVRAEGVLEVYAMDRPEDDFLLFVAWRYPKMLADYKSDKFPGIAALREAVGGRITIQGKE